MVAAEAGYGLFFFFAVVVVTKVDYSQTMVAAMTMDAVVVTGYGLSFFFAAVAETADASRLYSPLTPRANVPLRAIGSYS